MFSRVSDFLKQRDVEFKEYEPLSSHSAIRIGGCARIFATPDTEDKLCDLVGFLYESGIKYKVVGGSSNLLFDDGLYNGVIVSFLKLKRKNAAECLISAECGIRAGELFRFAAGFGLGGAEGLAHIPGTLGGLIYMNAGAYGYTISELVRSVRVFDPRSRSVRIMDASELGFSYRRSIFQSEPIIALCCEMCLVPGECEDILARMRSLGLKRRETQPLDRPSLGSTFKRVGQTSAGYYIDKAGLKGLRIGGAEVSEKHAGFVVNAGGATASDVLSLISLVKARVFAAFGVMLEEEIEFLDGRS
ncbi:MAG: UDP-N-acetylmuramate dehydrogenase [Clostridia bacterium]|nr:UDP-N-acetylmuramate dehydrogenase [Clostridia bacterium]